MDEYGYYKCVCGNEYISSFPYNQGRCKCGRDIQLTRKITEQEAKEIEANWMKGEI